MKVADGANDPNTTLGDFHDGTNSGNDYAYDDNGNLISDANKKISTIAYNYLDLPENITVTGKGDIKFVYDADGNKLQKIVTDNTASPDRTITTSCVDGFVYKDDTLQFFGTEEGRIRPLSPSGEPAGGFTYDYFVRDHLGDVRMVLTEQTDFSQYLATMPACRSFRDGISKRMKMGDMLLDIFLQVSNQSKWSTPVLCIGTPGAIFSGQTS